MTGLFAQSAWSLDDLFVTGADADVQSAFDEVDSQVKSFEACRPSLSAGLSQSEFLDLVAQLERIYRSASRIGGYARLRFAADTQDQAAQAFMARVDQFMAGIMNRTLFFSLWWKGQEDHEAERFLSGAGDVRYWLEAMRHFKPYTLSEPEEKIINIKDVTGSTALGNLYDSITNRYTYRVTVDGQEKEMTRGELMVYVRHPDPELRAAAYRELYRVYGQDGPILGQIYQTLVRDWRNENLELRGYDSPITPRNLDNDIPAEVVDTLLEVCRRNAGVFQRFFQLKARALGMERLRRYDVYAPLSRTEKFVDFTQGVEMVLDSFREFDPRLEQLARRVFAENHLDSEVRKGKRGGAFCATITPDFTPWVLVNYQGRSDDVATLAHELGHAIHSMLAEHHSIFTQHASLPMAETASTFGEMMLVDRMLSEETDPGVRRDMIYRQVDDAYATILRQAYFAMFERQAHEMIHTGAQVDELAAAYLENLKDQFGDSVDVSDEFRWEWVSIPHIYQMPFYVYAYSFGQLLVLSLYKQYKAEGESFKPRYLEILSAGGSEAPVKVLSNAGIDVSSADFWQGGFDVVAGWVAELERMGNEAKE